MITATLEDYVDSRLGGGKRAGSEKEYHCPFCVDRLGTESSKRKLRVNFTRKAAYCHRCEYRAGGFERLLRDLGRGSLTLEEQVLCRRESRRADAPDLVSGVRERFLQGAKIPPQELTPVPLPASCVRLVSGGQWVGPSYACAYMQTRGVSAEVAEAFDTHVCTLGASARYLIFPIHLRGEQVYWTSRYAGEPPAYCPKDRFRKTLNVPGVPGAYGKSDVLLGFDAAFGAKSVVVVEGPFDALAAYPTPAVALLGRAASPAQVSLLLSLVAAGTEELILALDPDASRQTDALRSALAGAVKVSVVPIFHGDLSSRTSEVPQLLAARVDALPLASRVRLRLAGRK